MNSAANATLLLVVAMGSAVYGDTVRAHEQTLNYPGSMCTPARPSSSAIVVVSDHVRNDGTRRETVRCPVLSFHPEGAYGTNIAVRVGYRNDRKQDPGDRIQCSARHAENVFEPASTTPQTRSPRAREDTSPDIDWIPLADMQLSDYQRLEYDGSEPARLSFTLGGTSTGSVVYLSCTLPPRAIVAAYGVREF